MPELPEVETVCRGLAKLVGGRRIMTVTLRRQAIRTPIPKGFVQAVEGAIITKIARRAKYILMHLDNAKTILFHLGMSGRMLVEKTMPKTLQKHDHAVFELDGGQVLIFNDARRFGMIDLCPTKNLPHHPLLENLGLEPLSKEFNAAALKDRIKGVRAPIKAAIMDQRRLVGVGNIYACEALHLAKVCPARVAATLKPRETAALAAAIPETLNAAIASGGSTLRDYVRSDGDLGYFQHHFRVYGKAGKPCSACGTAIKRLTQSGRSTFYCPRCQR